MSCCTSTPAQTVTVSSLRCDGQIPTAHRTSTSRYRVTNFWYVTWARVRSTLSRYGVTVRENVTSVDAPLVGAATGTGLVAWNSSEFWNFWIFEHVHNLHQMKGNANLGWGWGLSISNRRGLLTVSCVSKCCHLLGLVMAGASVADTWYWLVVYWRSSEISKLCSHEGESRNLKNSCTEASCHVVRELTFAVPVCLHSLLLHDLYSSLPLDSRHILIRLESDSDVELTADRSQPSASEIKSAWVCTWNCCLCGAKLILLCILNLCWGICGTRTGTVTVVHTMCLWLCGATGIVLRVERERERGEMERGRWRKRDRK